MAKILTFTHTLNVSVQPGDMIYYCTTDPGSAVSPQAGKNLVSIHNTKPTKYGYVIAVNHVTKEVTVGKVLPDVIAKTAIRLNKEKQNNFDGYKGKEMVQQYAIPEMLHHQLKEQSGLEARTGLYDKKKMLSILDDPDNKYLKSVPHKIGNRKREI